ncbi:uncharacterized protein LOC111081534 [Drosophila obscura]|uniref:uncharacterized protein LOC111081534 n=1 Tax=Drosophila obscura TaxID=7282 RepID=UPI001BB124CC|nr:uncharacterized protein LOC111081534 [Drosophila obscura]
MLPQISMRMLPVLVALLEVCQTVSAWEQSYYLTNIATNNFPGRVVVTDLKIVGRDRRLNGTLTFLEDLYDHHKFTLELYSSSGIGVYKPLPMEVTARSFCAVIRTYYHKYIKNSLQTGVNTSFDFKDGNLFMVPNGTYWIKDVLFNTKDWAAILPRGLMKAKLDILDNNDQVGGVEIIVDIKDKTF